MKIPLAVVVCLLFFAVFTVPAHAQCPGGPSPCLLSFSITPGAVDGDLAHTAQGQATAYLPTGVTSFTLVLSGPGGTVLNEQMACDPPGFSSGYMSCSQPGNTAKFRVWGRNVTGSPLTDTVVASIIGGTNSLSQSFTLNPIPTPWVTPDQDPDMPCDCEHGNPSSAGNPVNVANGNTWIPQRDYSIPGLGGGAQLERTWNSLWTLSNPPETYGVFGHSWRSNFEERIQTLTGGVAKYWKGNGSALFYLYTGSGGIYNLTAPANDQTTLSFNSSTTLWTVTEKNGTVRIFNNAGYLTSITDNNGNTTSISIDAAHSNRIATVTDAVGRTLTFNYANGTFPRLCTSVTDATGTVASYTYDSSERLTQVAYPDGSQFNFSYNSSDLILNVTDASSKVIEAHTYDSSRRGLTTQQANDSGGHAVNKVTVAYQTPSYYQNTVYDSLGNGTTVTVSNVAQRHFLTAASGTFSCGTCSFFGRGSSTVTASAYFDSRTDGNGNATYFTYDSAGNMLTKSLPVGNQYTGLTGTNIWSYSYNAFGEVTSITDPLGHTTTNAYDTHGNLTSTTTPSPDGGTTPASVSSFTYGTAGQLLTITDPLNHTTTLAYYSTGLIHTITDAQSHVTTYVYDARGNRTSVTDANSQQTQFAYDSMNRLTLITYPDTTTVQFAYDNRGRRTSVTDQNSKVTTYAYDDADRLTSVTDPASHTTTYAYDTENNLTDIYDALGNHTNFDVFFGSVPRYIGFPSGYHESYSVDSNSNIIGKTDRNGQFNRYVYDYQDRLLYKIPATIAESDYTYDAAGRMTQVLDYGTGTYGFTYDDMNRLKQTTTNYSFDSAGAYTVQYGYDAASNRTSMTDPQSGVTTYTYDSLNRLSNLQDPSSHNFGFSYDALSRRTQLTRPNGVNSNYSYDNLSRLLSVLHQVGSTTLDGASYTYDSAGNRTAKTDHLASVTSNYTYDNLYQLTQVTQGASTTESYSYDSVGNRLSSLGVSPYAYNSSNELTSTPSTTYTYDHNGNTTTKVDSSGTTTYNWDSDNELTSVVLPASGGTVSFKYDPFGRRIQKSSTSGTVNYLYDRADLLEEIDNSGNVLARYTHGRGIDQPLSMLRSGTSSYYLSDGIRSVTSLSNSAGALANTYTYDSYGKVTTSTGVLTNPLQFTAREFDQETELYYYRARHYDSQIGRFMSEDPIRFLAGNNFYDYVLDNPTNLVDPTGKFPIHGRWCGPDWTGGRTEQYDPTHDVTGPTGPYYNHPIDYTDSVCRDHDICYYECRRDHKCDRGARRNCMKNCDATLVYNLVRYPSWYDGPVDALSGIVVAGGITINSNYPNAGDNDKACPECKKK